MPTEEEFFETMAAQQRIRVGVRAIVFNRARDHLLVQSDNTSREPHVAFPGGGLELGETFKACLAREFMEETGVAVVHAEFLFVVENFIRYKGTVLHGVEQYFDVRLEHDEVVSCEENLRMVWVYQRDAGVSRPAPSPGTRPHRVRQLSRCPSPGCGAGLIG